jgi:opacity protein-like surface antigen
MNFYVGGALGLSMFKGTLMATEGNITGSPQPVGHKKNLKNKMPAVALTFGLQQKGPVLTDFGVMALYGATTINQKTPGRDNAVTDKNTIQEKYRFVLHAAAGVPLTPAVSIFGKLGLVYSNFSIGYKEVGTSNGATESMMGLGVAPGIMVQYKVSETLSTNLDLSYIIYKGMATNNLAAKIANYSYKTKIAPRIMTVMIGGSMKLGAGS